MIEITYLTNGQLTEKTKLFFAIKDLEQKIESFEQKRISDIDLKIREISKTFQAEREQKEAILKQLLDSDKPEVEKQEGLKRFKEYTKNINDQIERGKLSVNGTTLISESKTKLQELKTQFDNIKTTFTIS